MIYPRHISISISTRALISLLLLFTLTFPAMAQKKVTTQKKEVKKGGKLFKIEKDSVPVLNGFELAFNLSGAATRWLSDRGEYEGALRLNIHDQYFPVIEVGVGSANHETDEVTGLSYKTTAPCFRRGCDINLLKNKHDRNRLYAGIRYAFTSYKIDVSRVNLPDPVWMTISGFGINGETCNQHWAEVVFGLDAYIWGPLHLGWDVRYKRRIAYKESSLGNTWYVPGYGISGDTRLGVNFNVIIDI